MVLTGTTLASGKRMTSCGSETLHSLLAMAWVGHCVTSASQGMLWSAKRTAGRQPAWV